MHYAVFAVNKNPIDDVMLSHWWTSYTFNFIALALQGRDIWLTAQKWQNMSLARILGSNWWYSPTAVAKDL
jgi:hypothetical protein